MMAAPTPEPPEEGRRTRPGPPPPPDHTRRGEHPTVPAPEPAGQADESSSWEGYGTLDGEGRRTIDPLAVVPGFEAPAAAGAPAARGANEPSPGGRTDDPDAYDPAFDRAAYDAGVDPAYRGSADDPGAYDAGVDPAFWSSADDPGRYDPGYDPAYDPAYDQGDYEEGYGDDDYYDDDYDDDPAHVGPDQALGHDEPPYPGPGGLPDEAGTGGRRARRDARLRSRAQAREARWQRHRLAVPYRTDGPKLTFGVGWFILLVGAIVASPVMVALLVSAVAALAGMQIAFAWFPRHSPTRWWAAGGALAAGLMGIVGSRGVILAVVVGVAVSLAYAVANPSRSQSTMSLAEVAMRAIVPVGVAAASLAALAGIGIGAVIALVALVSAYEIGDFLVGSGSTNAVEGPVSGLVSLGAVVFLLWVVTPTPFTSSSIVLFGVLTGVGCVVGQIFASAILPRGAAWAPALRRLDSYLLVAPIWVLLLASLPDTTSL
ncbi:MAG: hypothetical protein AAFN30_15690 [Actinomycetota bacterium]